MNLALGGAERQLLGLFRRHQQRDDVDGHRLALLAVLFELGAGSQHLNVAKHELGRHVFTPVGGAGRRQHVHLGAGQHVAGHADHLVDAHRHGALAFRNHHRQARPGHRAFGPLDHAQVVGAQFGAELEVGGRDDHRSGRQRDRLDLHFLHVAVGAVGQTAAGGEGQKEHEGDTHAGHWAFSSGRARLSPLEALGSARRL